MKHDFLERIIADKKIRVEAKKTALAGLKKNVTASKLSRYGVFKDQISIPGQINLIAEIKKASPSKGLICEDFDALKLAKIYFSVFGDEGTKKDSLKGLERARTFIQNELSHRVHLRYLPVLRFYLDESWNYGARIDRIIDDLQHDESSTPCKN